MILSGGVSRGMKREVEMTITDVAAVVYKTQYKIEPTSRMMITKAIVEAEGEEGYTVCFPVEGTIPTVGDKVRVSIEVMK